MTMMRRNLKMCCDKTAVPDESSDILGELSTENTKCCSGGSCTCKECHCKSGLEKKSLED